MFISTFVLLILLGHSVPGKGVGIASSGSTGFGTGSSTGGAPAGAPTLVYVNGGVLECTVGWQPVSGAAVYTVYRSTSATSGFEPIYTAAPNDFSTDAASDVFYFDSSTSGGATAYYYYITATVGGTEGPPSNTLSGISSSDPAGMCKASGGDGEVTLTTTITGAVNIYRATSTSGPWQIVVSNSSTDYWVDWNVTNGNTYYYAFTNVQGSEAGGWCNPLRTTTTEVNSGPGTILPNPILGFLPDPMTFPEWMEQTAPTDAPDAPGGDTATASGGPASAFSVNLCHGVADVDNGADIVSSNPTGPDISFERRYRTAMAAGNLSSPGLPAGWTHNWDYRLVPLFLGGWGTLQLVYPNGASEPLTPTLDGSGNPTGTFLVPTGAPYVATGIPTSTPGVWASVTLQHNGVAAEIFTMPIGDTVYRMSQQIAANGTQINLTYSTGELTQIDNGVLGAARMQLNLNYLGGLLNSVTDVATGYSRTYGYTTTGGITELTSVSAIGGGATEWSYQYQTLYNQPYITTVGTTDPQGNPVSTFASYDASTGKAVGLTDAKGDTRTYGYSVANQTAVILTGTSGNGDQYNEGYDNIGRVSGYINAAGDTTAVQYSTYDPSVVTEVAPPLGAPETVQTDNHGNPTQINHPYGNYTVINWSYPTWAPFGLVSSVQEFGVGAAAVKQPTTYTYYGPSSNGPPAGYLATMTSPTGGVVSYTYSQLGNVLTVTGPMTSASYTYGSPEILGQPLTVADATGDTTQFSYTNGRLTGITDPLGNSVGAQYNAYDQVTNLSLPLGRYVQYSHNSLAPGKSAVGVNVSGTQATAAFDQESAGKTATDANLNTTSVLTDTNFNLTQVKNGNGGIVHTFSPNPSQRSLTFNLGTGANGLQITATVDRNGNFLNSNGSDGKSMAVTPYAPTTDPSMPGTVEGTGYSIVNPHDASDPPLTQLYGTNKTVYSYDSFGRVVSAITNPQTVNQADATDTIEHQYTFDDDDNLLSDTMTIVASTGTTVSTIDYTYNLDDSLATMYVGLNGSTSTGAYYVYGYDQDARVDSINVWKADVNGNVLSSTEMAWATYEYDKDGRVVISRTPQAVTLYTFDALGQLTELQNLTADGHPDQYAPSQYWVTDPSNGGPHTIFSQFSQIQYDGLGDRTSVNITDVFDEGQRVPSTYVAGTELWTYDSGQRLTGDYLSMGDAGSFAYGNQTFTYDNANNVSHYSDPNGGITYAIDPSTDEVLNYTYEGVPFSLPNFYDASGNDSIGTELYGVFDSLNQKVGIDYATAPYPYMYYDDGGNRVLRQWPSFYLTGYTSWGNLNEASCYDKSDHMVYRSATGTALSSDGYWSDMPGDFNNFYLYGPTGLIMEFNSIGNSMTYTWDPQGSLTGMSNGIVLAPYFNPAYGDYGPQTITSYYDQILSQPFFYKGQYGYQSDSDGLVYCHHRYYNTDLFRWLTRDPSGLDGGVNVYEFCNDNPVMFSDPSGLDVGFPGFWESMTPVYGSGRIAVEDFQTGHPFKGLGWALLAVTEFDPFEDLVEDGIKLGGRGISEAAGKVAARDAARSAERRTAMAVARGKGLAGEAAVKSVVDIGPRVRISMGAGSRVPDGINAMTRILHEIKNVKNLRLTGQIVDYSMISEAGGYQFTLWIREGTHITKNMADFVKGNDVILRYIPR